VDCVLLATWRVCLLETFTNLGVCKLELGFGAAHHFVNFFFFRFQGIASRVCRSAKNRNFEIHSNHSPDRAHTNFLIMGADDLLRVCKKCGVGVLDESEPERIKNCIECRAEKRAKVNLRKSSLTSSSHGNGKQTRKGGKSIKKLEGKAKVAGRKMVREEGTKKNLKKRGLSVFRSSGELCEELRSEALDAFDGRYLLEFEGNFDSVCVVGGVKEQVRKVTEELVGVDLLYDE